jgi:two-component system, chemotaxis family, CheB/CheR fusion protein
VKSGVNVKQEKATGKPEKALSSPRVKRQNKAAAASPAKQPRFPIVGIGASAGGLEALQQLFSNMPADTGMSFVIITHLDPTHESILPEILSKTTGMPVSTAKDGMKVQPNSVFVIPQNKNMGILNGSLQLLDPTHPHGAGLPIDFFLRSLAQDQGNAAICIILSGTGSDGTLGLKAIKAEAGITIVQDPDTAKYDGMPRSALETHQVDFVLDPVKIPRRLQSISRHLSKGLFKPEYDTPDQYSSQLQKIFILLRQHTQHDFSQYKPATLNRRIERRMNLNQIDNLDDYVNFLQIHPEEGTALFKEILINVTSFFRDPLAFEALSKHLQRLILSKNAKETFRVWVPGCATGEEAYSIAILVRECLAEAGRDSPVQLFATDLDIEAVNIGRGGTYPAGIQADISPGRLKRYFTKNEHVYTVKNELREMVVFAIQDIARDPPFSKVDLICCRNLLIYFNSDLQNRLVPVLHYSLNKQGILFLGPSESIGKYADIFTILDKKWKIFQRAETIPANYMRLQLPTSIKLESDQNPSAVNNIKPRETDIADTAQKILLHDYAPACVVIDQKHNIIYVHGQTGRYLELPSGEMSLDIINMAREGLKAELVSAIRKATTQDKEVVLNNLLVKENGGFRSVNLTVKPLFPRGAEQELLMVIFQETAPAELTESSSPKSARNKKPDKHVEELEQELKFVKEDLQTTIEELETTNEELKSANEELQSTNEELQSTNEELETSREELQSINEELMTVNTEHQAKIEELSKVSDDLLNLLNSTDMAMIFLDNNLYIRRYTPSISGLFNIIKSDIGRPLSHVTSNLVYHDLIKDLESVLDTLNSKQLDVATKDGHWFNLRILPYRTADNVIGGLVVNFIDIDDHRKSAKNSEELVKLKIAQSLAQGIVDTVREPLVILNADLKVISANHSFYRVFRTTPEDVENKPIFKMGNNQWNIPELRRLLDNVLHENTHFDDFKVDHVFPVLGRRVMLLNARRIEPVQGQSTMILLGIEDVTASEPKTNSHPDNNS